MQFHKRLDPIVINKHKECFDFGFFKCILGSIIRTKKNRYTLNLWPLWPKQFLSPIFFLSYHVGKELSRTERKFESSQLEEEQKSKAFELTLGQMKTDISNLSKKYFYHVHTSQTTSQTIVFKNPFYVSTMKESNM